MSTGTNRSHARSWTLSAAVIVALFAGTVAVRTATSPAHDTPVAPHSPANDSSATLGVSDGPVSATPLGLPPASEMATRRADSGGPVLAAAPPATQTEEVHTGEAQRPTSSKLLIYRGGAVQTSPRIYLVLWGSTWASRTGDPNGVAARLHSFYLGLGGSKVASVLKEYRGSSGAFTNPTGQYRGYIRDNSSVPTNPTVTDLTNATKRAANQVNDFSFNAQYVIAMPWGVVDQRTTQLRACAWHAWANTPYGWVTYTALPYTPYMDARKVGCGGGKVNGSKGVLDGVTINALHEYTESVNDPGLNAWSDSDGDENADKCSWTLLANVKLTNGKLFPAQPTWSNAKRRQYGYGCSYSP